MNSIALHYPKLSELQHGDILLPRPPDVESIASPIEALLQWMRRAAHLSLTEPERLETGLSLDPPGEHEIPAFSLVAYWPTMLSYLRRVVHNSWPILSMLKQVRKDLGSLFNADDLGHAVIGKQYVGHCAIVDRVDDTDPNPWVIESSHTHGGLHSVPYAAWLQERKDLGASLWLYRIETPLHIAFDRAFGNESEDQMNVRLQRIISERAHFVDAAHRYRMLGVRYAIFDGARSGAKFSLDTKDIQDPGDAHYLYCSELVLVCAEESFAVDLKELRTGGKSASANEFKMFTPKDITLSKWMLKVHGRGDYSIDAIALAS